MINVIDRFSSCFIFINDILFINLLLIISMIGSLFTNDHATRIFSIHVAMNMRIMSSSSFRILVITVDALIIASLIIFFWLIDAFRILYLDVNDCKFHANFFLSCWLSLRSWFMSKLIIKFIIFCMLNRFLFLIALIEFDTFNFFDVINFFTYLFATFILATFFSLNVVFSTTIDSSSRYFIIYTSFFFSSKSWN